MLHQFVFPSQATPFPTASVALDTTSGRLCKTYSWPDTKSLSKGLPRCSAPVRPSQQSDDLGVGFPSAPAPGPAGAPSAPRDDDDFGKDFPRADRDPDSFKGASTVYLGYNYAFDDNKWVKGSKAWIFNPKTQQLDPLSADPFDPVGLFTKKQKIQRMLSASEIQAIADQFGVSHQAALRGAKNQGRQVPKVTD